MGATTNATSVQSANRRRSIKTYDVIIVGQGYAGLVAAGLCAEAGLATATFEQETFGGLILNVNHLWPTPEPAFTSGVDLASDLFTRNMELGVENVSAAVTGVSRGADGLFIVDSSDGQYRASQLIVASGAHLRKLGVPGEEALHGRGVSYCADCDGPMFQGQEVVVAGGGDSAFQEAIALAQYCSRITIVHRGHQPRARAELVAAAHAEPKISLLPGHEPTAIVGEDGVTAVRLRDRTGGSRELSCSGVFVFIGLEPNTAMLPTEIERSGGGFARTSPDCESAVPGLWVIGAAREGFGGTLQCARRDAEAVVRVIRTRAIARISAKA